MLTCNLQGGLGNQLFQIFTTIALSLKTSNSFFFQNKYQLTNDADITNGATVRYTYWETFLSGLKPFIKEQDNLPFPDMIIKEKGFNHDPSIILNLLNNQQKVKILVGYFQSHKYFDIYKKSLIKLLKIEGLQQLVYKKVESDIIGNIEFETSVSIHFRLGDYKKLQDYHPILSINYYINALKIVINKKKTIKPLKTVIFFCEDDDLNEVLEKVDELIEVFPELDFCRGGQGFCDWEQMMLMSLCSSNIIANSTFSWWGAYFNTNPTKNVCYPATWFGPRAGHDTSDLFPDDWIMV